MRLVTRLKVHWEPSIDDSICSRMLNYFNYVAASAPLQLTADAMKACNLASWNMYDNYMSLDGKQPFVWVENCDVVPITDLNSSTQLRLGTQKEESAYLKLNITLEEFNDSYEQTNSSHILWAAPPSELEYPSSIIAVVAPDISDVGIGVQWYWTCPAVAAWHEATVNNSEYNQIQAYPTGGEANMDNLMSDATNIISIDPAWAYNATENAKLVNEFMRSITLSELLDLSYLPADKSFSPWEGTNDWDEPYIASTIISGIIATAISAALTVNAINVTYANITYKRTDATMPQGIWMPNITVYPQSTDDNEPTFPPGTISPEEAQLLAEQDPTRSFVIDVFGRSLIGYAFESIPALLATVVICLYCFYVLVSHLHQHYRGNQFQQLGFGIGTYGVGAKLDSSFASWVN